MSNHPDATYCLATGTMAGIAEAQAGHLKAGKVARPADIDHLVQALTVSVRQAWTTAGPVEEWDIEPDEAELAAIEAEWPVLAAELAVVEAQCRFLASPDVIARRALRRAETARDRAVVAHHTSYPLQGVKP